ncbi:hypothetical protein TNCV_2308411 [Trichonephila clavipes]|nr:hypothetical protein TNCV_2308411 [Trichonephila clavipes]
MKNFSTIARPLHKLTEAKQKFIWTVDCNNAFNKLKDALTSAPILAYSEIGKQLILDTDASHESIGPVLSQEIDGQKRVIAYFSKCLSKPERNYCVTRKELLTIVKAVEHFHPYLYGRRFLLRTDHASLTRLLNFKNSEGQITRWIQRLQKYDVEIHHRKGSAHGNADALSRRPCLDSCKHCSRIEKKFGPSWQDIAPFILTTKRYRELWDSLHLRNGVLYRKWDSDDGKTFRWQLILPETRVSTVFKELHGSPTGGHFRVMKTLQKVRPRKRIRGRLQLYNVGAPFERIAFDILGPLPRSSDGNNNNILVVMDYFTKWPEAYPIPDQEASIVAEVLVQHWISRFGVPLQLHSNQGRNFESAVCKRLCEIFSIDKTRTTALYPQSDGMVERFKRTILNSLSLLVSSNQQDWDMKLPFFLLAYRSAVNETTGYSPSQMLFGRDIRLPAALLFSRPPDAPLAPEEYIEELQARMEEMHHLARERIGMASEKMKTRYDARATGHDFHEGDKVWLWNLKRRKGISPKLQTNWEGPYTVLKRLNDVVVRIQKSPHSKPKVIYSNRLAPYLGQDE